MDCPRQNDTGFYRLRKLWEPPCYRLVEEHFDEFKRVYPGRFQHTYGLRPPSEEIDS